MTSTLKIFENGDREWMLNGKYHRENGLPAIEKANGDKEWWVNGKRRETPLGGSEGVGDLPAVEWADGYKKWYVIYHYGYGGNIFADTIKL